MKCQIKPSYNKEKELIRRYLGHQNKEGQINLVRNTVFEPALKNENFDSINDCLRGIQNAFFWNKPAIITSHRLNYIGYLDKTNRSKNLKLLDTLLTKVLSKWPNVEFMTSTQLGNIIQNEKF